MKTIIVTGLSGSGKSEAMNIFEDMGYYCIDNMPPSLIMKFRELGNQNLDYIEKVAFGIDIRGYRFFEDFHAIEQLLESAQHDDIDILFLEAKEEVLVRRYKMSRRSHPLARSQNILEGIREEKKKMKPLRQRADHIIDTGSITTRQLKEKLIQLYQNTEEKQKINLIVNSFGFKHGIPIDSDLVFDVRFLPNPYYVESLKTKTGNEPEVQEYVMNSEESHQFMVYLKQMIDFLIPNYIKEGKTQLLISIGCTGGKHRSVTVANKLYEYLEQKGYRVFRHHRDADKI